MSLFSWLFSRAAAPARLEADSSGLGRLEATRPAGKRETNEAANGQPANRKKERMARRELLYSVVRDAMMRAGVLSASYKFKVLSLDGRGRQFLVMVDLARDSAAETAQLAELEALIAQAAKSRYDIVVTAVYWRTNEHVAVGAPARAQQRGADSHPVPLDSGPGAVSQPVRLEPAAAAKPAAAAQPRPKSAYEPIQEDEVAAFKRALAAGAENPAAEAAAAVGISHGASARAFDGSVVHGPRSYTLLTGFEDTEMPGAEQRSMPTLSGTQYGDLN
jgi:hypothetical protein